MNLSDDRHDRTLSPAASAVERLPHLVTKICALWGQSEFDSFVNGLVMDSRDGKRQGLPWEAALELLFLAELSMAKRALVASETTGAPFQQAYEKYLNESTISGPDPWTESGANKDVRRQGRAPSRSRPPGERTNRPEPKKKSWWRRIFG
jgi:hypothetical protein